MSDFIENPIIFSMGIFNLMQEIYSLFPQGKIIRFEKRPQKKADTRLLISMQESILKDLRSLLPKIFSRLYQRFTKSANPY